MLVPVFFIVGLFLVVMQVALFTLHPTWLFAPDLYYVLVAFMAYRQDPVRSLLVLFPLSWVFDVCSGTILGMYPALFLAGYLLLYFMNAKLPVRASLYQVPLVGVSYLAVTWLVHITFDFFEPGVMLPWSWPQSFVRAILVVLMTYPLFRFFEWLNRRLRFQPGKMKLLQVRGGNRRRRQV